MRPFTINMLLQNKNLDGIKLLAGADKSDNAITNVNIIDNPDTYDWLSAGDFILSTGYIFKDSEEMQENLINELADINCSGLGIKIMRYFDSVPQRMIATANERGLPVISIPFHYELSKITRIVNAEMMKQEDTLLEKSIQIHTILTKCSLTDGNLGDIADKVMGLINNPLIIVDSKWRLLAYAEHPDNKIPLDEHLSLTNRERVFPKEFVDGIPQRIEFFTKSIKRRFPNNTGSIVCRVLPVAANQALFGYLVAWETVSRMGEIDSVALEHAATTVALERLKTKQIEETRLHLRQDFFDELLNGKIESVNAVNNLAEIHHMDPQSEYICMIIKINRPENQPAGQLISSRENFILLKDKLINHIDSVAYGMGKNVVSIYRGDSIISFIKLTSAGGTASVREFVEELYHSLERKYQGYGFNIGVGQKCGEFLEMRKTYMQAREAVALSAHVDYKDKIYFYENLMVYHLLGGTTREQLEEFYSFTVAALVEYDKAKGTNMVETLERYFSTNRNISLAADQMFLHRNTFIYRIEKIKSLLGSELKNPEELLELQLGLKVMRILKGFKH